MAHAPPKTKAPAKVRKTEAGAKVDKSAAAFANQHYTNPQLFAIGLRYRVSKFLLVEGYAHG